MKNIIKLLATVIVLSFVNGCASPYKSGLKKFDSGEYHTAIVIFEKILQGDTTKKKHEVGKINYRIAESYRLSNQIAESLPYYEEAFDDKYYTENSEFYYGYALKANGKYNEAFEQFKKYVKEASDFNYVKRAKDEIRHIDSIRHLLVANKWVSVENCDRLNTAAAEFSPVIYKDNLVFTSSRKSEFIFAGTGGGYLDLYYYELENLDQCVGEAYPFSNVINLQKYHEASPTFSKDGKTMIFARSNVGNKKDVYREVDLYQSRLVKGEWTEAERLPISSPKYWDSTPVLSRNGKRLYFASNRPGGLGGVDIWQATRTTKGWSKLRNMGRKINTKGNEMFPYIAENGNLYFSSDGHIGLGGLDIFVATRKNKKITVTNMGTPINSVADDFGIVLTEHKKGFFSSNRKVANAKGNDDIYIYEDKTPSSRDLQYYLAGNAYFNTNANDSLVLLPGVSLTLLNNSGAVYDKTTADEKGRFKFPKKLEVYKTYTIVGEKKNYIKHREEYYANADDIDIKTLDPSVTSVTFERDVKLYKDIFTEGFTDPNTGEVSLLILYDLDKSNIRTDAAKILDQLVEYLLENKLSVELGSHTDVRGSNRYNLKLSQRRAQSAVDYLILNGIPADRLIAKGYGETDLEVFNAVTEEEHQLNRRTTLRVIYEE